MRIRYAHIYTQRNFLTFQGDACFTKQKYQAYFTMSEKAVLLQQCLLRHELTDGVLPVHYLQMLNECFCLDTVHMPMAVQCPPSPAQFNFTRCYGWCNPNRLPIVHLFLSALISCPKVFEMTLVAMVYLETTAYQIAELPSIRNSCSGKTPRQAWGNQKHLRINKHFT
jgi:hypothetical protein